MPATDLAHPEKDRPLSIEEYKRIQQFPDSWNLVGDIASQYRQLGNAVPVGMGQALGRTLRLLIEKKSPSKIPQGFFFSRYKNTDQDSWSFLYKKTACCSKDSQLSLTF
jgi:DNA (cytosine-5)-methyltransferase 1